MQFLTPLLPSGAREYALEWDLLRSIQEIEANQRVVTQSYWSGEETLSLDRETAKRLLKKLKAAGLITSTTVGKGRATIGTRFGLTENGKRALAIFFPSPALATPVSAPVKACSNTPASLPGLAAGSDLYALISEQGRARLESQLPADIHARIVSVLKEGFAPDLDTLTRWGVRPDLANAMATAFANTASRAAQPGAAPLPPSGGSAPTSVSAASDEDVARAVRDGVPVPAIEPASETQPAAVLAQHAKLLVAEAAVRRPHLLSSGLLLARLPQLLWSMTAGCVADYGKPLLRARALLRMLDDGRFSVPRGYQQSEGAQILRSLKIALPVIHTPVDFEPPLKQPRICKKYGSLETADENRQWGRA